MHLQRFLTKNDSITARAGYPVLVRLSTTTTRFKQVLRVLFSVSLLVEPMWSVRDAEHAAGRHERLTVAMLLAETNHHAAPRGQTMARSGVGTR